MSVSRVLAPVLRGRLPAVAGALIGVAALLVPSVQAVAADDPQPVPWPKIQEPDGGGTSSDPGAVKWPTIQQPATDGTANDPKPVNWPQVHQV